MKKFVRPIDASLIPQKEQALDTLNVIRSIYESDTSGLLSGKVHDKFIAELDAQIADIQEVNV